MLNKLSFTIIASLSLLVIFLLLSQKYSSSTDLTKHIAISSHLTKHTCEFADTSFCSTADLYASLITSSSFSSLLSDQLSVQQLCHFNLLTCPMSSTLSNTYLIQINNTQIQQQRNAYLSTLYSYATSHAPFYYTLRYMNGSKGTLILTNSLHKYSLGVVLYKIKGTWSIAYFTIGPNLSTSTAQISK